MAKQLANIRSGFQSGESDDDQTVIVVTQLRKVEVEIAGKECRAVGFVQVTQNFLLVVPFRSPNLKADLPEMNSPLLKLFGLISGDVVIQNDPFLQL